MAHHLFACSERCDPDFLLLHAREASRVPSASGHRLATCFGGLASRRWRCSAGAAVHGTGGRPRHRKLDPEPESPSAASGGAPSRRWCCPLLAPASLRHEPLTPPLRAGKDSPSRSCDAYRTQLDRPRIRSTAVRSALEALPQVASVISRTAIASLGCRLPLGDCDPARSRRQQLRVHRRGRRRRRHRLGVATWHDDLTIRSTAVSLRQSARHEFVDFVNGASSAYDDNGHGTHVAGIIAGNGYDSSGENAGIAPGASLVSLKVLDANGNGTISNVIAALDWVAANRPALQHPRRQPVGRRGGHESYWTDPLTLAAKPLVDAGIVVVAAAGNLGKNADGRAAVRRHHRAGQRAVGAHGRRVQHERHARPAATTRSPASARAVRRSSTTRRSPTWSRPASASCRSPRRAAPFYTHEALASCCGSARSRLRAVPEPERHQHGGAGVAGTVALMLQANPTLTPNLVKAILQYTAQHLARLQPAAAGRRLPQRARRRPPREVLRDSAARPARCRSSRSGASRSSGATTAAGGVLTRRQRLGPASSGARPDG